MKSRTRKISADINDMADLKTQVMANAVATGNMFAFHDLFAKIREFAGDGAVTPALLDKIAYLLPTEETTGSAEYDAAKELVARHDGGGESVHAAVLEETARRAVLLKKFAYAEDAYRLLGIKKEIVALYAQAGEHFLHEGKPKHAAMAFYVAAELDRPAGPHFHYLGPQLHENCMHEPEKCVTTYSEEELIDIGIRFLISNESLAERLLAAAEPEARREILAVLAFARDMDFDELVKNLREAVEVVSGIDDGRPDDYSPVGVTLLGRTCGADQWWQYLREFAFEHPFGALCVCVRFVRQTPVLVPIIRDGKSIIEFLLPPEYLSR
jgi:hypothetical protein